MITLDNYLHTNLSTHEAEFIDFVKDNEDKVNWDDISFDMQLTESFMELFHDKIDWFNISGRQVVSEPFIEKYKDLLEWESISTKQY